MFVVDVGEMMTVENKYGIKFTREDVEIARANNGIVSKRVRGKEYHFKFTLYRFPYDLMPEEAKFEEDNRRKKRDE